MESVVAMGRAQGKVGAKEVLGMVQGAGGGGLIYAKPSWGSYTASYPEAYVVCVLGMLGFHSMTYPIHPDNDGHRKSNRNQCHTIQK